jgi:phosphoglucan,water dikinase
LILHLEVPEDLVAEMFRRFGQNAALIARSSSNCEDLEELAGAGLYESVANVPASEIGSAIRAVWASLWTRRAALARRQAGLAHKEAHMAVLVQETLTPDFSFVLHTVNPINQRPEEVYVEIAAGLGETLVSAATPGTPYRLVCDKRTGNVTTLAFANFRHALSPRPGGGLARKTVDYSRINLTDDSNVRMALGRRLASIAEFVERAIGQPQDIEGALVGEEVYLVQSRRQQGSAIGH